MRAAVVSVLIATLSSCNTEKHEDARAAPAAPAKVPLVAAERMPSPDLLVLTGVITADRRSAVTADTQGKVVAVLVERGQRVKTGDPVVRLDVRAAALSVREAQANLEAARAQARLAEQECKRVRLLLESGAIPRSEYDRQIAQCTETLQQVSAAQARAELMAKSVSDGLVHAPFDGRVAEKSVSPGEWVAPGRTLCTLVGDPLRIELSVPEVAVHKIEIGQKVLLSVVARPGKTYTATISRLGGEIDRTRALIVEATLDGQGDLVPGMFAEARVVIGRTTRLVVPKDAIRIRGKRSHVFVAVRGELEDRIVQLGAEPEVGKVAILQGLAAGDRVVAKLTDQITDGLRVIE